MIREVGYPEVRVRLLICFWPHHERTLQFTLGLRDGVMRARTFRNLANEDEWNITKIKSIVGTHWPSDDCKAYRQ
jgi:hypothetical protein